MYQTLISMYINLLKAFHISQMVQQIIYGLTSTFIHHVIGNHGYQSFYYTYYMYNQLNQIITFNIQFAETYIYKCYMHYMIDWYLTPTLAIYHLYRGAHALHLYVLKLPVIFVVVFYTPPMIIIPISIMVIEFEHASDHMKTLLVKQKFISMHFGLLKYKNVAG